jgi:hypothetical protein
MSLKQIVIGILAPLPNILPVFFDQIEKDTPLQEIIIVK